MVHVYSELFHSSAGILGVIVEPTEIEKGIGWGGTERDGGECKKMKERRECNREKWDKM